MKYLKRNRGIGSYLAKKITRRHLRSISKEYIETRDQLAMFSFDFISQMISGISGHHFIIIRIIVCNVIL